MRVNELRERILSGALIQYSHIYSDIEKQSERFISAIDAFAEKYGEERDIFIFSVPGRSEIIGNHTDHNNGCVMAGAINRDIIAVVAKNDDGVIRFQSRGYPEDVVNLEEVTNPDNYKKITSRALVAGVAAGFINNGYAVGGYDAFSTTEVLKGSGLSSSAAFEVMVGNILNHLYNGGEVDNKEIAKIAQFSENVYFGKPCGLMDQMACAVGGFVYIDFKDEKSPIVEPIDFSLIREGYSLCIINTGGNHASLGKDYAAVPGEMKAVAAILDRPVLRGVTEGELIGRSYKIRRKAGDRALLRALHFVRENNRVVFAKECLKNGNFRAFLGAVSASGKSSFEYLQNVYTAANVSEQGLSLALAITEGYLAGKGCAWRVHGGGFAGTIQCFIKNEYLDGYVALMNRVFGDGATMPLNIRPLGAVRLY